MKDKKEEEIKIVKKVKKEEKTKKTVAASKKDVAKRIVKKVKEDETEKEAVKGDTVKIEKVEKIKPEVKIEETRTPVSFSLIEVIVIIIVTGLVVSVCSGIIVYKNYDDFVVKTETKSENDNGSFSEFINSYNKIINSYVEDINKGELIDAAIQGMYNYLGDRYSSYLDVETTETLTEQLEGKYSGVGVEITLDENSNIVINRVFADSPAMKAGIKAGDIIVSVNDVSMVGKMPADLANMIKKGDKTTYSITYKRDDKETSVTIDRKQVLIDSVSSKTFDSVGYIKLDTFSNTTSEQIKNKIDAFDDNVNKIIIDVRNNTGGYLSSAYNASELFVEKGKTIYQLKDKKSKITKYNAKEGVYKAFDKIVVLVNSGSASASEILTSALKESANATVVGVKTFGKGTVQETERLSSGAMVKYTTAYWLTPNGNSINELGIKPDVEIDEDFETEKDEQLDKALEVINE